MAFVMRPHGKKGTSPCVKMGFVCLRNRDDQSKLAGEGGEAHRGEQAASQRPREGVWISFEVNYRHK